MDKLTLTLTQAHEFVQNARYEIDQKTKFSARCIDGRYAPSTDLPPLAIAGGDAGQLAAFMAASAIYGFELDAGKLAKILTEEVGGSQHLGFHTDGHAKDAIACAGCGHIKQMRLDPAAYNLTADQVKSLDTLLNRLQKDGAREVMLDGDHHETAVMIVSGPYALLPQQEINTDEGALTVQVFSTHKSLTDARNDAICERLVAEGAVKLAEGLGQEYLYECISEVCDNHLMETAKRLAKGLPIFSVRFSEDGVAKIEDMGPVA